MSKGILNKRDKMLWDNTHKPDGVNDTLDLVSEHIEDIVEDHIEGIGESTTGYSLDYKVIADITFEQTANVLNIDFDDQYRKLIVRYSHPAITDGSVTNNLVYVKTDYGNFVILADTLETVAARTSYAKTESLGVSIISEMRSRNFENAEHLTTFLGLRMSQVDVSKEYVFKGVQTSTFNIPVGANLLILGVK